MPLLFSLTPAPRALLGVWHCEADTAPLLARWPWLTAVSAAASSPVRRRERLCTHALLYALIGESRAVIGHDADGRPLLTDWHISVSGTTSRRTGAAYVALLLSRDADVGIDIELCSPRPARLASAFLAPGEPFRSERDCLLAWSAKETLYKLHSASAPALTEIRLHAPIPQGREGEIQADIPRLNAHERVRFTLFETFALTFALKTTIYSDNNA